MSPIFTSVGMAVATMMNSPALAAESELWLGAQILDAQPALRYDLVSTKPDLADDTWVRPQEIAIYWPEDFPPECRKSPIPKPCLVSSAGIWLIAADPGDPVGPLPAPLPY